MATRIIIIRHFAFIRWLLLALLLTDDNICSFASASLSSSSSSDSSSSSNLASSETDPISRTTADDVAAAVMIATVPQSPISTFRNANYNYNNNNLLNTLQRLSSYRSLWSTLTDDQQLMNSLRDRLVLLRPILKTSYPFARKRSCFINAGMTNNCDFKDLISATSARRIWQSPHSPGKRSFNTLSRSNDKTRFLDSNILNNILYQAVTQSHPRLQQSGPVYDIVLPEDTNIEIAPYGESHNPSVSMPMSKRMQCISGLPGGDCENSFLGGESMGQDFLRPGGRNPGRR